MGIPCTVGVTGILAALEGKESVEVTLDGQAGHVWLNIDNPIIDANTDLESLTSWITETSDTQTLDRVHYTGPGCWDNLFDPVCLCLDNLDNQLEIADAIIEAMTFEFVVIDLRETSEVPNFQSYTKTLGIQAPQETNEDQRADWVTKVLRDIAEEYDITNVALLLDAEKQQASASVFFAMGYEVITQVHDLEQMLDRKVSKHIAGEALDVNSVEAQRLNYLLKLEDPEYELYSPPQSRERQIVERLNRA